MPSWRWLTKTEGSVSQRCGSGSISLSKCHESATLVYWLSTAALLSRGTTFWYYINFVFWGTLVCSGQWRGWERVLCSTRAASPSRARRECRGWSGTAGAPPPYSPPSMSPSGTDSQARERWQQSFNLKVDSNEILGGREDVYGCIPVWDCGGRGLLAIWTCHFCEKYLFSFPLGTALLKGLNSNRRCVDEYAKRRQNVPLSDNSANILAYLIDFLNRWRNVNPPPQKKKKNPQNLCLGPLRLFKKLTVVPPI